MAVAEKLRELGTKTELKLRTIKVKFADFKPTAEMMCMQHLRRRC